MQDCPLGSSAYRNGGQCASQNAKQESDFWQAVIKMFQQKQATGAIWSIDQEKSRTAAGVRAVRVGLAAGYHIAFAFSILPSPIRICLLNGRIALPDKKGIIY
jgi:predicted kinase